MVKETLPVAKVEYEEFSLDHVEIGKENEELDMSYFAYACKMRYPLNLVLENIEYL